ncbi:hypothetical protein YerA41_047 [Yersinia phage YerA41]|nr:hypothetical protein YerA41_047 [Yersinia phage YerA41]
MSDENKVVHAEGLFDSLGRKIREESKGKNNDSSNIFGIEDTLIRSGWNVKFHAFKIDDMTAYVDYDEKVVIINIDSSYYALQLMDRIMMNIDEEAPASGKYKYQYLDGELKTYTDGSGQYNHLYLSVTKIDEMIDYDSIPEPERSANAIILEE